MKQSVLEGLYNLVPPYPSQFSVRWILFSPAGRIFHCVVFPLSPHHTASSPTHTGCDGYGHPCLHLRWNCLPFSLSPNPSRSNSLSVLHEIFPVGTRQHQSFPFLIISPTYCQTRDRNCTVFGLMSRRFRGYLWAQGYLRAKTVRMVWEVAMEQYVFSIRQPWSKPSIGAVVHIGI